MDSKTRLSAGRTGGKVSAVRGSGAGVQALQRAPQERRGLTNLLFFSMLIYCFVPPHLLDLVEHYTSPGGSIIEKIHPGAILLYLIAGYVFFTTGYAANRQNRMIADGSWAFLFSIAVVVVLALLFGQTQGASYLIDTLALGPIICLLMLRLSDADMRRITPLLLSCLILNDLVLILEFALKHRFLPYPYVEEFFRPTAFLGHPLHNGLVNATAIAFLWLTDWRLLSKVVLSLFFLIACFVAGARMASLIAIIGATASGWLALGRLARRGTIDDATRVVFAVGAVGTVVFVVFLIVIFGFADRLIAYGFFSDQSSQSRIAIYQIFNYMTPRQFMLGMPHDLADYIQIRTLNIPTDESPITNIIVEFGLVGLSILLAGFAYYYWKLARAVSNPFAWTGLIVYLAIASTNNQLASKGSHMAMMAIFMMGALGASRAIRSVPQARSARAPRPALRPSTAARAPAR